MAQQGEKSHGQLRRDDQIGIDAQPLSLLDKVGIVGFMGGVALAVDGAEEVCDAMRRREMLYSVFLP